MALLISRLQDLLSFFPENVHHKIETIYQKIPGSLLNYLNPISINKKVECREQQLPVDSSIQRESDIERHTHSSVSQSSSADPFNFNANNSSSSGYSTYDNDNHKYENALRFYLLQSIKKTFGKEKVTEVDPASITTEIIRRCFEQCPDWGRKSCNTPSVIIRFDRNYIITEHKSNSVNLNVYTYAYLACERESSRFCRSEKPPQITFEVTIELTGSAIALDKIDRFCQMLSKETISDVITKIETTNKVTFDNLDPPSSTGAKKTLTWDDV